MSSLPIPRSDRRSSLWRRPAIIGAGSFLMLLGVPGIVLPILPGWLLIGIGFILLSQEVPFARRLLARLKRRFPALARGLAAAEARLRGFPWRRGRS